jgi:hypothetical protein
VSSESHVRHKGYLRPIGRRVEDRNREGFVRDTGKCTLRVRSPRQIVDAYDEQARSNLDALIHEQPNPDRSIKCTVVRQSTYDLPVSANEVHSHWRTKSLEERTRRRTGSMIHGGTSGTIAGCDGVSRNYDEVRLLFLQDVEESPFQQVQAACVKI